MIIWLAILLAACATDLPQQPTASGSASIRAEFQAALDAWAASPAHQGVEASVIFADGTRWDGVAGTAGREPMRLDHLVSIASITKTMTGALTLQLASEGRLSLDDPLSRWLPARSGIDPAITIRQLLNHTSGVSNYTGTAGLADAIRANPAHTFTPVELLAFVGPPAFRPGERTLYTNTAFLLLGQVVERVTGSPILQSYRERLWQPPGLTEFRFPGYEALDGPVAQAWVNGSFVSPADLPAQISVGQSAFGLFSTARVVASWGRALFTGSVLAPAMQAEMRRLVPAAGNIPGETGTGLGIRSYHYLDRTQYGHSGGSVFGSSLLLFDPTTGVTVAVVMNQGAGADHFVLAPNLLKLAARQ
jgi:D-alanyl-D-alanine carboxypeptidase